MSNRRVSAIVLACVGTFAAHAGAQTIDGQLQSGPYAYGEYPFRLATQTTATGFGNNQSQLDAVYVNVLSDGSLAYMMTGNIESNGNGFITMLDNGHTGAIASTDATGYGTFRDVGGRYTYSFGTRGGNSPGSIMSPGFNPAYALETNLFGNTYYQDVESLFPDGTEMYIGSNAWRDKIANTGNTPPASPVTQNYAPNNTSAGTDANITSAYDDNNTITFTAGSPTLAMYGYEATFSPAFLRQKPGTQLKVLNYIAGGDSGYLSNQFLPGLPSGTSNLATVDAATPRFNVMTQTDHPATFYMTVPTPTTSDTASSTWSTNAAWNTGFAPNGINTQAALDTPSGSRTVTLASPVTVGTLYLTGAGNTTLAGSSALTLQTYFGDTTVVRATGNATITAPVLLAGDVSLEIAPGKRLTLTTVATTGFNAPNVAVSGGGTVVISQTINAGPTTVTSGLLDLKPGATGLFVGTTPAVLGAQVATWYASGARNGSGIGADTTNALITVGVIPNDDGQGNLLYAAFAGTASATGDTLAKATYLGDTDLNGVVNGNDLANLLAGMNGGLSGWQNGDTDYSGTVDATDLSNLLTALRTQGAPLGGAGGSGAVPEPAATAALLTGVLALVRRRRSF